MKKLKVFIIMSLMMIFLVKPRTVLAKSLDSFQPKMINENSNYRIYQKLTRKGPAGSMVWHVPLNMAIFKRMP